MNYKEIMTNSSVFHLCCKFTYVQRYCYCNFCGLQPVVAYHIKIDIHISISHKFFLLLSLYSTCFSHADHPEAFKYITLKPKINVYISIYMQLVNAVMNLQIPLYAGNFLTSWEPVELLKKVSVQCSELVSNGFIFWLRGILSWLKFSL